MIPVSALQDLVIALLVKLLGAVGDYDTDSIVLTVEELEAAQKKLTLFHLKPSKDGKSIRLTMLPDTPAAPIVRSGKTELTYSDPPGIIAAEQHPPLDGRIAWKGEPLDGKG